ISFRRAGYFSSAARESCFALSSASATCFAAFSSAAAMSRTRLASISPLPRSSFALAQSAVSFRSRSTSDPSPWTRSYTPHTFRGAALGTPPPAGPPQRDRRHDADDRRGRPADDQPERVDRRQGEPDERPDVVLELEEPRQPELGQRLELVLGQLELLDQGRER